MNKQRIVTGAEGLVGSRTWAYGKSMTAIESSATSSLPHSLTPSHLSLIVYVHACIMYNVSVLHPDSPLVQ